MKWFFAHDLNPVPWKVTTKAKDGNLENYQRALQSILTENYTEEERAWPDGLLSVRFVFRRSTSRGNVADLSNITKATEDAIQDIITGNDRNNARVESEMFDQAPGAEPMVFIEVGAYEPSTDYEGIETMFDESRPRPPVTDAVEPVDVF